MLRVSVPSRTWLPRAIRWTSYDNILAITRSCAEKPALWTSCNLRHQRTISWHMPGCLTAASLRQMSTACVWNGNTDDNFRQAVAPMRSVRTEVWYRQQSHISYQQAIVVVPPASHSFILISSHSFTIVLLEHNVCDVFIIPHSLSTETVGQHFYHQITMPARYLATILLAAGLAGTPSWLNI